MLGVDGHDLAWCCGLEHERAARDERLLVGQGQPGARLEGRKRGAQAEGADQRVEHDVGLGVLDQPRDGIVPGIGHVAQCGRSRGVGDCDVGDARFGALTGQQFGIAAARGEAHDLEAVGVGVDDLQRLGTDRPGAAQDQYSESAAAH